MTSFYNYNTIDNFSLPTQTSFSYTQSIPSTQSSSLSPSNEPYTIVNEGKTKKFICNHPNCSKVFRFKSEIERHLSAHSGLRPHNCTYEGCKKSFKRADALDDHIRSQHTGEAPLVCPHPDCGMRFSTTAKLRYHAALHDDQKPYKCQVDGCDRSFVTLSQLKQHEKSNLAHRRLGLTPERKGSEYGFEGESPVKYNYEQSEPMINNEAKKRVKYDATPAVNYNFDAPNEDYYGMPKYENVVSDFGYNLGNEVQFGYENMKLNEQPVEKREFLTNVLGENDTLKKRLNYTENMIHAMKGQLDKVMLMLPNQFDHVKLLGYNKANGAANGLPEGLLPEVDNFFF